MTKKRALAAEVLATCSGLETELAALRAGHSHEGDLIGIARIEAIHAVVHQADGVLSPTEMLPRLHAAGRDDDARSATATLDRPHRKGWVKIGRGRFTAG